jgi:tetratricopeptide (TPR) repeat protein
MKGENNTEAEKYFNQAITLTEDPGNKADMYMQIGTMKSGSTARDYYRKALASDPTKREAYAAIGYLYYQSFEGCAGKADIVKDRATFLAAYDMFERAGNNKMMEAAKEQFPSKEEIFTYNYTTGDNISVDCWIGESTVIRTRD